MNIAQAHMSAGRAGLAILACFAVGWLIGGVDTRVWQSTKALLAETYLNKFNAMSGANVDEYLYYVVSDDGALLQDLVVEDSGIKRLELTDFPALFHIYIDAASKREMLFRLRALPSVSAVFTVPFMCH